MVRIFRYSNWIRKVNLRFKSVKTRTKKIPNNDNFYGVIASQAWLSVFVTCMPCIPYQLTFICSKSTIETLARLRVLCISAPHTPSYLLSTKCFSWIVLQNFLENTCDKLLKLLTVCLISVLLIKKSGSL